MLDDTTDKEAHVQCKFELGVEDLDGVGKLKCVVRGPGRSPEKGCKMYFASTYHNKHRSVDSFCPLQVYQYTSILVIMVQVASTHAINRHFLEL